MTNVKTPIRSTLRQKQALATRSLIVSTARALFLERGYSCTTIEAIAESAGVAVSTVYAIFGSKRAILTAIREAWHGQTNIREVVYGSPQAAQPAQRLEQLAYATRLQWEIGSEVIAIYTGAAAADPEAANELAKALEGRRRGLETFAASLGPYLRQGLDVARAAAIIQALCLPEVYKELVQHSGWTAETYQSWLLQALKHELLEEAG